jgi:hypothetical protein
MQLIALSCPKCGSALARNRARCEYCGTVSVISSDQSHAVGVGIACPKCNATNDDGKKHCGECGGVLVIECPKPRCLEENSIWRKHCQKCGSNMRELWREKIQGRTAEIRERLTWNRSELERITADLAASQTREKITKAIIVVAGVFVSLWILLTSGFKGIGIIFIAMAIALIWAAAHKSEEKTMLRESMQQYLAEIEEFETESKSLRETEKVAKYEW